MKEEKKSTTRKKKAPTTERSKKDPRRLANGDFTFGNEIGKETRFKPGDEGNPAPIGNDYTLKYDDIFVDLLREYYDGGYQDIGNVFPTKFGFPRWLRKVKKINISASTMSLWTSGDAKYAHRFKEAFDELHDEGQDILHNGALSRKFDAGYSKLLASAIYGISEKQMVDNTVKIVIDSSSEIDEESN